MVIGTDCSFVMLTVLAPAAVPIYVFAKDREAGEKPTALDGVETVPVPVNDAIAGEPAALELTVSVPLRVPLVVGSNDTITSQLLFAASVLGLRGQFVEEMKSDRLVATEEMVTAVVSLLVSVKLWGAVVEPTCSLPKFELVGVSVTAPLAPLPLRKRSSPDSVP